MIHDLTILAFAFLAALLKVLLHRVFSVLAAITTIFAAMFLAHVFTNPVLKWLQLPAEDYKIAVAVLLALFGEGLMSWLLKKTPDDLLNYWRGKKNDS